MNECNACCWWEPNRRTVEQVDGGKHDCTNPEVPIKVHGQFGCVLHLASTALEINVPQHCKIGTMDAPNPNPVDGPVEIVIVTYGTPTLRCSGNVVSDLDWLRYALRSIRRHCSGFQGVTVVHPEHEKEMFDPLAKEFDVRLHSFPEPQGKGMLAHMVQMANADSIVPPGTKYILHSDADCIFKMLTRPEHYFWNDKPYYIVRTWDSLTTEDPRHPGSKVISDCAQWRGPTEAQLGFPTPMYTMCMNTAVLPIDFYARYRKHITVMHGKPFETYMLEGKNDHPATRMDWTAFGAFAYRDMNDRFTWFDVEQPPYPVDRKLAFWSHAGLSSDVTDQIERLLQ
jgi:hypothetical protein